MQITTYDLRSRTRTNTSAHKMMTNGTNGDHSCPVPARKYCRNGIHPVPTKTVFRAHNNKSCRNMKVKRPESPNNPLKALKRSASHHHHSGQRGYSPLQPSSSQCSTTSARANRRSETPASGLKAPYYHGDAPPPPPIQPPPARLPVSRALFGPPAGRQEMEDFFQTMEQQVII